MAVQIQRTPLPSKYDMRRADRFLRSKRAATIGPEHCVVQRHFFMRRWPKSQRGFNAVAARNDSPFNQNHVVSEILHPFDPLRPYTPQATRDRVALFMAWWDRQRRLNSESMTLGLTGTSTGFHSWARTPYLSQILERDMGQHAGIRAFDAKLYGPPTLPAGPVARVLQGKGVPRIDLNRSYTHDVDGPYPVDEPTPFLRPPPSQPLHEAPSSLKSGSAHGHCLR